MVALWIVAPAVRVQIPPSDLSLKSETFIKDSYTKLIVATMGLPSNHLSGTQTLRLINSHNQNKATVALPSPTIAEVVPPLESQIPLS